MRIPSWFSDARLGMFIHYGIYSLFGGNENEIRREVGRDAYAAAIGRFHARDADPDAWARLARRSGCDYLVLTAKHGEGFCLWPSRHTPFHIGGSPCRRDLVAETVRACRRHGLRVGIYFGPQTWISGIADDDRAGYRRMVLGMLDELLTGYGRIDLLWFDDADEPRLDPATATALFRLARRRQPAMVINDRGFPHRGSDLGDYSTPERFLPDRTDPGHRAWEGCDSIGVRSWGWHRDERFWSVPELARRLATAAALGGRYLLNVQPEGGGRIRPECAERMLALGAWLRVHRRAVAAGGSPLTPRDACDPARPEVGVATAAPGRTHLLLSRWPSADEIVVPHVLGGAVSARLSGARGRLRLRCDRAGLRISGLPAAAPGDPVPEIVITGRLRVDQAAIEAAGQPEQRPGPTGTIRLGAEHACATAPTGVPFHHRKRLPDGRTAIGFFFHRSAGLTWRFAVPRAGRWRVCALLARPDAGPGAAFTLRIGAARLAGTTVPTADWDSPAAIDCGTATLRAGRHRCRLAIGTMPRGWFADVHGVILEPA